MRKFTPYAFTTIFVLWGLAIESAVIENRHASVDKAENRVTLPAQPSWLQKIFEPGTFYLKREGVESA